MPLDQSLAGAPQELAEGAQTAGQGVADFLVSGAERLPGGKALTGYGRKAYNDVMSPVIDFYRGQYMPRFGRGGGGFSSMGVPQDVAQPMQSAVDRATEAYLRSRLMAANEALEADGGIGGAIQQAGGDVAREAKRFGGDVARETKQLGGDVASAVKETIRNPFKRFRRRW